jgi:hypothetical protein
LVLSVSSQRLARDTLVAEPSEHAWSGQQAWKLAALLVGLWQQNWLDRLRHGLAAIGASMAALRLSMPAMVCQLLKACCVAAMLAAEAGIPPAVSCLGHWLALPAHT